MHSCACECTYVSIWMYVCMSICAHVHACVCAHICATTHVLHMPSVGVHVCACGCEHGYVCVCVFAQMCDGESQRRASCSGRHPVVKSKALGSWAGLAPCRCTPGPPDFGQPRPPPSWLWQGRGGRPLGQTGRHWPGAEGRHGGGSHCCLVFPKLYCEPRTGWMSCGPGMCQSNPEGRVMSQLPRRQAGPQWACAGLRGPQCCCFSIKSELKELGSVLY